MSKSEKQNLEEVVQEAVVKKSWKGKLVFLLLIAVLGYNSVQLWNMSETVGKISKYNQGVVDEVGGIKGDIGIFASDLNEIRQFLLLPTKKYSVSGSEESIESTDQKKSTPEEMGMFALLDGMAKDKLRQQNLLNNKGMFSGVVVSDHLKTKFEELQLTLSIISDQTLELKLVDKKVKNADGSDNNSLGQALVGLVFDQDKNQFKVQSILGEQYLESSNNSLEEPLWNFLKDNVEKIRQKKIEAKQLLQKDVEVQKLAEQKKAEQQVKDFENLLKQPAWQDMMKNLDLKLSEQTRKENNKLIYDVLSADGKVQFSFAMEISSGLIKVIKDGQENALSSYMVEEGSKKKP